MLPNWYSLMKKLRDDFWHTKLTLKVKFWHFLTPLHYINSQNSIISFGYVDFWAKILLILYPPLENSITRITILLMLPPKLFLINWWPMSFGEASFNQFYAPHARPSIPLGFGYGTSPKSSSAGVVFNSGSWIKEVQIPYFLI